MPATPCHNQDPFDPEIQKIAWNTEQRIYGDAGGVATDANVDSLFRDGFERPRNSALAHDVLKTDRWKMKGTMTDLADRLGTDHGTISRWYHRGELPYSVERFLMANPNRPSDWQAPIDKVFNARHRNAFIFVARYLFGKLPGYSPADAKDFREIHAELLFTILKDRSKWEDARKNSDFRFAQCIVQKVCDQNRQEIVPFWYIKKDQVKVQRVIKRLCGNNRLAFQYLCILQRRWEPIFILTWAAAEGIGWL